MEAAIEAAAADEAQKAKLEAVVAIQTAEGFVSMEAAIEAATAEITKREEQATKLQVCDQMKCILTSLSCQRPLTPPTHTYPAPPSIPINRYHNHNSCHSTIDSTLTSNSPFFDKTKKIEDSKKNYRKADSLYDARKTVDYSCVSATGSPCPPECATGRSMSACVGVGGGDGGGGGGAASGQLEDL